MDGEEPSNFKELTAGTRTLVDRLIYDQVDAQRFAVGAPNSAGRTKVVEVLRAYRRFMDEGQRMDFARLEEIFLEKLRASGIPRFTSSIRALLVDEYQDTNPLQEAIYFKIVGIATASLTVVGDDDQSLYRFRGATVELFRDFRNRFNSELPTMSQPVLRYLIDNYRSTPEIVAFFNNFVGNDPAFAQARVQPLKPLILAQLGSNGIPVLGMFRSDVQTLARDLSQFLNDVFRGNGRTLQVSGSPATIIADPNGGDFGDAVILGHTVNEYGARWMNNPPKERLPKLLRDEFAAMGVAIFNPRGRQLRDIPVVQQLLGVMLECIDPPTLTASNGRIQEQMATPPAPARPSLRSEARIYLQEWRLAARQLIASNPLPRQNHTLQDFVRAWQTRRTQTGEPWPDEWPVLELCFKLLSWFPLLRDDPEGQVYLEAVTRCIAQAATYSSYRSHIINGHPIHADGSIRRAIGDIFAPMAEGAIDVEEDIMPSVPRSRLTFMTIHQAKGLEYPLVIVDVASDYTKDAPANRFRRFPEKASSIQMLEDDLAPYCNVGPLRTARPALARSFDDLIRLYYVAYSRPQSALMLVGLDTCLRYKATIKHLALGWRADQTWSWRSPVAATGRRGQRFPPMANNIPLTLV